MQAPISGKLRAMNDKRVRLAHHTSHHNSTDKEKGEPSLMPGMLDFRIKSQKYKPMQTNEVLDFTEKEIIETLKELIALTKAMGDDPSSPSISPAPKSDQPARGAR
jgi:hypothetical protein